jgi:ABC-type multidrug transport system fused ATPase/permease subunit
MAGAVTFEVAIAVLIITPEFFLPLRNLAIRYHSGSAGEAAAERLVALGSGLAAATPARKAVALRLPPPVTDRAPAISFQDVSYAYPDRPPVLRHLSLEIAAGELLALVGPSGVGKSTIVHLLLRFADPDEGDIRVDGVALAGIDRADWLRTVAWVPQRPHLLWGTAADAIRVGRPGASMEEVVEAARAAGADGFLRTLTDGYDTHLGEGARRLSGGQRQRLALARAFLRDASLVILDEPTSHLDAESEAAIAAAIRARAHGRTVIVIAHRPALAEIADRVVTLEGGRIVEPSQAVGGERHPVARSSSGLIEAGPG